MKVIKLFFCSLLALIISVILFFLAIIVCHWGQGILSDTFNIEVVKKDDELHFISILIIIFLPAIFCAFSLKKISRYSGRE